MSLQLLFCMTSIALASTVAPVPPTHVVHESRLEAPQRWIKGSRVHADSILPLRVGLTQSNLDLGAEWLLASSDPTSSEYGKHWTAEEVIEAFKPSAETTGAVMAWLTDAGIENVTLSNNKGWLAANLPASKVESLLYTEYYEYTDSHTGDVLPSTDRYHIPAAIQQHVDYVTPGLKLLGRNSVYSSRSLRKRSTASVRDKSYPIDPKANSGLKHCDTVITPECIAALYDIPKSTLTPNKENKLGLYETIDAFYSPKDLNLFYQNFTNSRIPSNTKPTNVAIDGGQSEVGKGRPLSQVYGGEIALDLDVSYPIVYLQGIDIWDENDLHYQKIDTYNLSTTFGFNQLLDAMDGSYCTYSAYNETGDDPSLDPKYPDPAKGGYKGKLECGVFKPPKVLSSSYGGQEAQVPLSYQRRQCNEFMKLGLQGTTFIYASGDSGVGDIPMLSGTPTGCLGKASNYSVFTPAWPNTCPWITNVGGTEVFPGKTVKQPESAVNVPATKADPYGTSSGGGFSNVYPIPKYQASAVAKYFSEHNPPYPYYSAIAPNIPNPAEVNIDKLQGKNTKALYNRIGRAYPDVSANAYNVAIVLGGIFQLEGGTSQAAPTFASIINRIVEERLAANKSSLGFLNPALYANPTMLHDITNGTNPGCNTAGFKAAPGWDPVTGLGTPDYPKMLSYFMNLQ